MQRTRSLPVLNLTGFLIAFLGIMTVSSLGASAQDHADWVAISTEPPGTPADVQILRGQTNPDQTAIHFRIHGFWVEEKMGDDGQTYQELEVPGIGFFGQPGAPKLPVIWVDLAIPEGVGQVVMEFAEPIRQEQFGGFAVWPQPIPELDHEEGDPEQFLYDEEIYNSEGLFPPDQGTRSTRVEPLLGLIPGGRVGVFPVRWDPSTGQVDVISEGVWQFAHPGGNPVPSEPITRHRGRIAANQFLNWEVVAQLWPVNLVNYSSNYLIIHPEGTLDELQEFIDLKWAQGFRVATRSLASIGNTCEEIRAEITNWYVANPSNEDYYCLLVGEENDIPLCVAPDGTYSTGTLTDDLYGSINGDDLHEEVYVGRLSIDSETDLANQLHKIIDYQTGIVFGWDRGRAALVAHKEGAPGKYEGAHEAVRTAVYANPPIFETYYGSAGATDADVSAGINGGFGVVAYRGHGSSTAWTGWNISNQYYDDADVGALTNGARTPIVWSFACTNSRLTTGDCIAEYWMEKPEGGAVSYYGATRASYTTPNHSLDYWMFQWPFTYGLTTQAQAIQMAEWSMEIHHYEDNSWMYLLLGDPSQVIRDDQDSFVIEVPEEIGTCPVGCFVDFRVLNELGNPIQGALASIYKENAGPLADGAPEVFDNRYTDGGGAASVPAAPLTEGELHYVVRDDEGHIATGTIAVVSDPSSVADGGVSASLELQVTPSVVRTHAQLSFGSSLAAPADVSIFDVAGRHVASLSAPRGAASVSWNATNSVGNRVAPGIYLVRLTSGEEVRNGRLLVIQ